MEKLTQETVNFTEKNIDRIAALFPSAITETKDADGKLKRAVNFDQLKQLLSEEVIDGDECYEFTWVGKKQSIIEGNRPIRKTLRPSKEESKNWETTENLYIEGDNLDVLKLLQNSYLNKVKMIYIPPTIPGTILYTATTSRSRKRITRKSWGYSMRKKIGCLKTPRLTDAIIPIGAA